MKRLLSFALAFLISLSTFAQPADPGSETRLTGEQLVEDVRLMREAMELMHAGLYRHTPKAEMDQHFDQLEADVGAGMTLGDFYLRLSRFLAKVQDGHTYANYYNQPDHVKEQVTNTATRVPFAFRLVEDRMIITKNASDSEHLAPGAEVTHLNGKPVKALVGTLMPLVKADGGNDAKRLSDLEVMGAERYTAFDVYLPMVIDIETDITVRTLNTQGETATVTVPVLTRDERLAILSERYEMPTSIDDLWAFELLDDETAYLQLGTFTVWNLSFKWVPFLRDAFDQMEKAGTKNLILDIRGNEGGLTEVMNALFTKVVRTPITMPPVRSVMTFNKVPERLRPYVGTWDQSLMDMTESLVLTEDSVYVDRDSSVEPTTIPAGMKPFSGHTYVLVGAANSSATFYLSGVMKRNPDATLVGQMTGGNLRGTTGGAIYFLNLPNSGVEVDVPAIATSLLGEQPDRGIIPDVIVPRTVADVRAGRDAELQRALE
ncbi:MAG: S41 family peptidase, partial [Bacteroidota bacterium]